MTNVALVGSGYVTALHALAARTLSWPIAALAERPGRQGSDRARQIGVNLCGLDDLPGGLDLLIVATDHPHRVEDALRGVEGGATVLIEPPIAATLEGADRLVTADTAQPGRIRYGVNLLSAPVIREAIRLVGQIGDLTHLEIRAVQGRPGWDDSPDVQIVGGALFELGIHPVGLTLITANASSGAEVVSVSARLDSGSGHDLDDHAELTMEFDSGLRARIEVAWNEATPIWDIQAASDTGVVRAELLPEALLEMNGEPVEMPITHAAVSDPPQLAQLGYVDQLKDCAAGFRHDGTPLPGPDLGLRSLEVVMAAYASAADGGTAVPIPFVGPRNKTPYEIGSA